LGGIFYTWTLVIGKIHPDGACPRLFVSFYHFCGNRPECQRPSGRASRSIELGKSRLSRNGRSSLGRTSNINGLLQPSAVAQDPNTVYFLGAMQGDDSRRKIAIDYQYFTKNLSLPSHN
jgi:hypothetical protein